MANGDIDFRFRGGQFPTQALVSGVQQRALIEEQIRASEEERKLSPFRFALEAAQTGIQLATSATQLAAARQKQENRKALADLVEQQFQPQISTAQRELEALQTFTQRRIGVEGPQERLVGAPTLPQPPLQRGQVRPFVGPQARQAQAARIPVAPRPTAPAFTPQQQEQLLQPARQQLQQLQGKAKLAGQLIQSDNPTLQKAGLSLTGLEVGKTGTSFQKENLLLPDGSVELGKFDTSTGEFLKLDGTKAPPGTRKAFSEGSRFQFFTDANTGQRVKEDLITGKRVIARAPQGEPGVARAIEDLTLKQRFLVDKRIDRYTKDAVRAASETALSQINQVELILATDVGFATGPLQGLVARIVAAEKGVLTDKDILRNSGNQAIGPKLKQLLTKWQIGKLSPQNKKELKTIISAIKKNSQSKLERRVTSFKNGIAKEFRLNADEVENTLLLPIFDFPVKPEFLNEEQKQTKTSGFTIGKPKKVGSLTITRKK